VIFDTTAMNANVGGPGIVAGGTICNGVDTYLKESALAISTLNVGSAFRWTLTMSKTAAGVTAATFNVRIGTSGTTADQSVGLFTLSGQTGVVDTGWCEIIMNIQQFAANAYGASSVLLFTHNLVSTGLNTATPQTAVIANTGSFTLTPSSSVIAPGFAGVSCNPASLGVWTFQSCIALGYNM